MGNKLFGVDISGIIAKNIGPGVLPATLRKNTPGTRSNAAITAGTNPTSTDYTCRGFIDASSTKDQKGGLTPVDKRDVVLIGDTIQGGAFPEVNDHILIDGLTFFISGPIKGDPANATYTCSCTRR